MEAGVNWYSHELYCWMDEKTFDNMEILHRTCTANRLQAVLGKLHGVKLVDIKYFGDGCYEEPDTVRLSNVSGFYRISLTDTVCRGHEAIIKVYLPVKWNGRFMGIAGAGSNLGVEWYASQTYNVISWPVAIKNGFACAETDGATGLFPDSSWGFDGADGVNTEMINYWASLGTHRMTVIGKAIVRELYGRPAAYSYFHGTSGGGRQGLMEVQAYPEDYDGVWGDGPALDFYGFVFGSLWTALVFRNEKHKVALEKFQAATALARKLPFGGVLSYSPDSPQWKAFLNNIVGLDTPAGKITEEDLRVMKKVWNGPVCSDGERMCYGMGPYIIQWPINGRIFCYMNIQPDGAPGVSGFAVQMIQWMLKNPKWSIKDCTLHDLEVIFKKYKHEYRKYATFDADITDYAEYGHKVLITHGTGDQIVPHQIIEDYDDMVRKSLGGTKPAQNTLRVFMPKGGGHSTLDWDGPMVSLSDGMRTLMEWTETGKAPETIRAIQYDFQNKCTVSEGMVGYRK